MKTLTNKEIITVIEHCSATHEDYLCSSCPLFDECLYYYTGKECNSALEEEDEEESDYEPDDINSDLGFDPYMGCFSDDC